MFEVDLILKFVGSAAAIWVSGFSFGKINAWIRAIGSAV